MRKQTAFLISASYITVDSIGQIYRVKSFSFPEYNIKKEVPYRQFFLNASFRLTLSINIVLSSSILGLYILHILIIGT